MPLHEDTRVVERRGAAHLSALFRVATVITSQPQISDALAQTLDILLEELPLQRAAAWLAEEETGVMKNVAARFKGVESAAGWQEKYAGLPELQAEMGGATEGTAAARLLLPLSAQARVLGAFVLESVGQAPLSERDVELATAVSLLAGIAADSRRSAQQMEEYGRLLMSIEKATMWLSSYLEREPILGEAIGFARSIFKASHVSIVELDAGGKTARVVRTASIKKSDTGAFQIKVGEGWCGRVLGNGKPVLSPDPETGRPPEGFVKSSRYKTDSFAIVPIFSSVAEGAEIVGAINVADKIGGRPFNARDLELLSVLARAVGVALQNASLYERATVDGLTRLYVRQHFFHRLEEVLQKSQKTRKPMSVLIADLDDFKKINDTYGHPIGDQVLREVGAAVKKSLRPGDLGGRYGGEEFGVLLPGATLAEGRAVAEKVLEAVRGVKIDMGGGKFVRITASMGLAELRNGDTAESLIARADAAQYRAKYAGKNRLDVADK